MFKNYFKNASQVSKVMWGDFGHQINKYTISIMIVYFSFLNYCDWYSSKLHLKYIMSLKRDLLSSVGTGKHALHRYSR